MAEQPRIDVARLIAITREVRTAPEHEQQAAKAERERREREEEEREAAVIIAEIPAKLEASACRGEDRAVVLTASVEARTARRWSGGVHETIEGGANLRGAARLVYDYCTAQGLIPTTEPWSSARIEDHGFHIVAHWKASR